MEMRGFEPRTSYMQSKRSTSELHPHCRTGRLTERSYTVYYIIAILYLGPRRPDFFHIYRPIIPCPGNRYSRCSKPRLPRHHDVDCQKTVAVGRGCHGPHVKRESRCSTKSRQALRTNRYSGENGSIDAMHCGLK